MTANGGSMATRWKLRSSWSLPKQVSIRHRSERPGQDSTRSPSISRHQFMASLHRDPAGDVSIVVKGAPRAHHRDVRFMNERPMMTARSSPTSGWPTSKPSPLAAQRVLAIATKSIDASTTAIDFDDVENGLTLLGLVGLIDPPRKEAVAAVKACRDAGVHVKMITGDHAITAGAIAKELGLENPDNVLTGVELDRLDDDALRTPCQGHRGLRAHQPGAQASAGPSAAGRGHDRRDDRRRRQRCARLEARRCRHRHGAKGQRGGERSLRDRAGRRQFRDHRRGRARRPHRLPTTSRRRSCSFCRPVAARRLS